METARRVRDWLRVFERVMLLSVARFADDLTIFGRWDTRADKLKNTPVSGDALTHRAKVWREYDRHEPASQRGANIWGQHGDS